MKIAIFALIVSLIFLFCGCSEMNKDSSISSELSPQLTTAMISTSKTDEASIVNTPAETDLEHAVNSALQLVQKKYINEGFLYDFDFDGIPELVHIQSNDYDLVSMNIYSLASKNPILLGSIEAINNLNYPYSFSLYYDEQNNSYFYIGEFSLPGKGCSTSKISSYRFYDDRIIEQEIAYCEVYFTDPSESSDNYIFDNRFLGQTVEPTGWTNSCEGCYSELDKYLSQFEKIKSVDLTPMWTMGINVEEKIKESAQSFNDFSEKSESNISPQNAFVEIGGKFYNKSCYRLTIDIPSNTDLNILKQFPNLYSLAVHCTDDNVLNISPLLEMKNITKISFDYNCNININLLSQTTWLEDLNVSYDNLDFIIGMNSLRAFRLNKIVSFEALYNLPNLIVISSYDGLTDEQYNELKENMPNCMIVFV
jgi:hypothetical protein